MKTLRQKALLLTAATGMLVLTPATARASSHMDAPLITLDDAANTTDVYAFVQDENGRKSLVTALGVYPFEEPGIGPNKFNFDDNVLYAIHVATGQDVAAGRPTYSYEFTFRTKFKNAKTILQSYLGVITDVDDAAQNLTQFYTVTRVDHRTGRRVRLGEGVVPPNNQGNATPFYNQDDNGENPAKDGVASFDELDRYTKQAITVMDDGYVAFAGQRDDGFYGDIQAVFDLLKLRNPGKDAQGGFNLHLMALAIPVDEIGGDQQVAGVWATTSRRRFTILADGVRQIGTLRRLGAGRAPGQPAVQRRPRGHRRQGPVQPDEPVDRQGPVPEVRPEPRAREAAQPPRPRARHPRHRDRPHRHRRDLHSRCDQGGPLDRLGAARRRRSRTPDQSR